MLALGSLKIQTEMSLSSSHLNYCWCFPNFTLKMWNFYYFECFSWKCTVDLWTIQIWSWVLTCTWIFFTVNTTPLHCSCLVESMDMESDRSDHKLYMNFQLGGRSVPLNSHIVHGSTVYRISKHSDMEVTSNSWSAKRVCVYDIIKNLTFSCLTVPLPMSSFTAPVHLLTCSHASSEVTKAFILLSDHSSFACSTTGLLLFFYPCYVYFLILLWFHGQF